MRCGCEGGGGDGMTVGVERYLSLMGVGVWVIDVVGYHDLVSW